MNEYFIQTTGAVFFKRYCSMCNLRKLCIPATLTKNDLEDIGQIMLARRKIKQGQSLFKRGDIFTTLYVIYTGEFKTSISHENGIEQVIGFQMAGETLGLDGIYKNEYTCDVIALEDAVVCILPYSQLEKAARKIPVLQRHIFNLMSSEIVRENNLMIALGGMKVEERLAEFLINLTKLLKARGLSDEDFFLHMSREDIASHLGMKIGTLSRAFSKLSREGILEVHNRHIRIRKPKDLKIMRSQSGLIKIVGLPDFIGKYHA